MIPFYSQYFSYPAFSDNTPDETYKDAYIRSYTQNNKIYKFVAITENSALNSKKLEMLKNDEFWASNYKYFNDDKEVYRKYNIADVSRRTGRSISFIENFFAIVNEMNNVSCFTYEVNESMWSAYANNSNGYCLEFKIVSTNFFFPVVYLDKSKLDYSEEIISSFQSRNATESSKSIRVLAILPWVVKDLGFSFENEVRFLCGDEYDDPNGIMGGRIAAGKKKAIGIRGIPYKYDYAGLKLEKVIISQSCQVVETIKEICTTKGLYFEVI